ncbi:mycothiol synthase, partial [Cumulibacter manganitolerans]|uniref:mycothiol synthase n=1 Tax=Cumulibacter manganitolerans TaxID=1884992 RepID=UPI0012967308
LPAAAAFGASVGAERIRTLLELRRPAGEVDVPEPAPGVVVRTFVPGQDDAAWLRVNAEAFATHPEQGAWTQQDLAERMAEPWFDPAGFFLAERDGELLAFHWTKIAEPHTGEVYVVGVSPRAQGLGLGRLMTAVGLEHLNRSGVREITLFVDGENRTAVSLYRSLGFDDHHADAQWRTR